RRVSRLLGWEFVDVDRLIQAMAGKSIPDIFAEQGEEAFRDLETAAAHRLGEMHHCVIATGGGFVLRPENREAAMKAGEVVLLMASPEQIWHRVERSRHRPLLGTGDPQARIRQLLEEREPVVNAVADSIGAHPTDLPVTPVRLMSLIGGTAR
ncbi:MAG: shikimate kinase, partial [Chloroflexi bacterium]|nr:shikimate kinase [Chloroflexota bacterium]